MAKSSFSLLVLVARSLKGAMVAVLLPLAAGLCQGVLSQLAITTASGGTFREWMTWGFVTYVAVHVLLYRPVACFRASHWLLSVLAVWLFGGQVAPVDAPGDGKGASAKGVAKVEGGQGSVLVAFSPYVMPLSFMLVCIMAFFLKRWVDRSLLDGPVGMLLGVTAAFHWLMTAHELQQQRGRWHVETYLLALAVVFVLTLLIGVACLPLAIPELSCLEVLAEGYSRAQGIYTTLLIHLF